jgi:transporter family-2 protein
LKAAFAAIALLAGAGLAVQAGLNSHLRDKLGHAVPAALTNFGVGLVCLVVFGLASSTPIPRAEAAARAPWWAWMGGVVGACYVGVSAAFAKKLGAAGWLGAIVTGQVLASLALDHFGLVGFDPHPISTLRLVGVALLIGGVLLVLRF